MTAPSAAGVVAFSVGCATQAWAVDATNAVFYYGTDESWQLLSGTASAARVSASDSTDIWYLTSAQEDFRSQGLPWNPVQVPGGLTNISAASDGTVWGVSANQEVFSYGPSGWTQMPGALTQIAVGSARTRVRRRRSGQPVAVQCGRHDQPDRAGPGCDRLGREGDGAVGDRATGDLYLYTQATAVAHERDDGSQAGVCGQFHGCLGHQ